MPCSNCHDRLLTLQGAHLRPCESVARADARDGAEARARLAGQLFCPTSTRRMSLKWAVRLVRQANDRRLSLAGPAVRLDRYEDDLKAGPAGHGPVRLLASFTGCE